MGWTLLGNMEGAPLPWTLRDRRSFRGWDVEGSGTGLSPYRGPVGEPGRRLVYRGL